MCMNVQHSAFTTTRHFLFQLLALLVKPQMLVLPNAHGLLKKKQTQGVKYGIILLTSPTVWATEAHCCHTTEIKIDQCYVKTLNPSSYNMLILLLKR